MWRASVLTIFPDMFPGPLGLSLAGRALAAGIWSLEASDIRDHALDRHRSVDDTPAGGGPGMVMRPDVLARAIDAVAVGARPRLLMSARGVPLTQARVAALAAGLKTVITTHSFTLDDDFNGAALVVDRLGEPDQPMHVLAGDCGGAACVDLPLLEDIVAGTVRADRARRQPAPAPVK